MQEHMLKKFLEILAGSHNALFRGKDITSYFNDRTLWSRISSGTFEDLFVGDYIKKNNNWIFVPGYVDEGITRN